MYVNQYQRLICSIVVYIYYLVCYQAVTNEPVSNQFIRALQFLNSRPTHLSTPDSFHIFLVSKPAHLSTPPTTTDPPTHTNTHAQPVGIQWASVFFHLVIVTVSRVLTSAIHHFDLLAAVYITYLECCRSRYTSLTPSVTAIPRVLLLQRYTSHTFRIKENTRIPKIPPHYHIQVLHLQHPRRHICIYIYIYIYIYTY